ncbi:uncharacterized protein B0I36DRAFT_389041 [Microdochium trichocladiopsis]|uniref:Zn(2)-C6 fungal-type domain-containing protein n=1 Tax=Microdochium trichocladiopsis TaxID=1682393 RepID=A0A9P8XWM8_9PEZI|nr:uncharacterized protein B0I36DRAFT_389041 [Microdochium trichocladiopsis]KAH7016490.1 hypothetical protein B0I36DRAFT_389041 [Microdochium trichocladiopsis]
MQRSSGSHSQRLSGFLHSATSMAQREPKRPDGRIVIIGAREVGKTHLLLWFQRAFSKPNLNTDEHTWIERQIAKCLDHNSTIHRNMQTHAEVWADVPHNIEIFEVPNLTSDISKDLARQCTPRTVVLLLYDPRQPSTLTQVLDWWDELKKALPDEASFTEPILVATHSDQQDQWSDEHKDQLAKYPDITYFDVSLNTGEGVRELIDGALLAIACPDIAMQPGNDTRNENESPNTTTDEGPETQTSHAKHDEEPQAEIPPTESLKEDAQTEDEMFEDPCSEKAKPCDACRKAKTRCIKSPEGSGTTPCIHCSLRGTACTYRDGPLARSSTAARENSPHLAEIPTNASQSSRSVNGDSSAPTPSRPRQERLGEASQPSFPRNASVAGTVDGTVRAPAALTASGPPQLGYIANRFSELYGLGSDMEPILMRHRPYDPNSHEYHLGTHGIRRVLHRYQAQDYPLTFHMVADTRAIDHEELESEVEAIEALVQPWGPKLLELFWRHVQPSYPIISKDGLMQAYEHRDAPCPLIGAIYLVANGSPHLSSDPHTRPDLVPSWWTGQLRGRGPRLKAQLARMP